MVEYYDSPSAVYPSGQTNAHNMLTRQTLCASIVQSPCVWHTPEKYSLYSLALHAVMYLQIIGYKAHGTEFGKEAKDACGF